jgi:hypothetical protein
MRWWREPTASGVFWRNFPDNIHPKTQTTPPSLIVTMNEDDEGSLFVSTAYRTNQKIDRRYSSEFRITKTEKPEATGRIRLRYEFGLRKSMD